VTDVAKLFAEHALSSKSKNQEYGYNRFKTDFSPGKEPHIQMALDLTLCTVPKQVEIIFLKAKNNFEYAEWVSFIPTILQEKEFKDFGDETIIQLKNDVQKLKQYFHFSEADVFYDLYRCSSTLDYLINEFQKANKIEAESNIIWNGGDKISDTIIAGQGVPLRLFNRSQIHSISSFFSSIDFSDLKLHFDYSKMKEIGVYKLANPENIEVLSDAFEKIKKLFERVNKDENLLLFKKID